MVSCDKIAAGGLQESREDKDSVSMDKYNLGRDLLWQ